MLSCRYLARPDLSKVPPVVLKAAGSADPIFEDIVTSVPYVREAMRVVTGQCSLTFCAATLQTGPCTLVSLANHTSTQASFESEEPMRTMDVSHELGTLQIAKQGPGVCVHVRQHSGRGEGVHRHQRNSVPDISRVPRVVPDEHGVPPQCQMYVMATFSGCCFVRQWQ
jgi:hypothetical protein